MKPEEQEKLTAQKQYQERAQPPGSGVMGLASDQCVGQIATPHPREILLQNINDQEQRLLDKLVALRQVKEELCCLPRSEAERLVKITRLMERVECSFGR